MGKLNAARQKTFDDFYTGATIKDAAQIRSALTDDFTMAGPMMAFDNPDAFVASLLDIDGKVTQSKLVVDGDDLVHLYVLDVGTEIPMCDVIRFNGDKFASMVLYTDSKHFDFDHGAQQ